MSKNKQNLDHVNQEIEQLERKKKHLQQKQKHKRKTEERRRRTHRLVQTGALAEKYFEIDNLTIAEREELFQTFSNFIKSNKPKKYKK